jgi:OmpA-OmpF porin, OOP family
MRGARLAVGTLMALLGSTASALAQTEPSIDLRVWRPPIDPDASMVLEPPSTPGPWRWNLAAWTRLDAEPVTWDSPTEPHRLVASRAGADIVAGLGIGQRLALGVDLPAFLQTGSNGFPPAVVSGGQVATSGIGDLSLRAKGTVVSDDHRGNHAGFGLAVLGELTLPTGATSSFMGDGDMTASLSLLAAYTLGPIAARAEGGYATRADWHAWPGAYEAGPCGLPCDVRPGPTYGASIPWAVGVALRPKAIVPSVDRADRQTWELAAHGALPAAPVTPVVGAGAATLSPALLALDDRVALGHYHDAYFVGGIEVGLDGALGVPDVSGILAIGWAPRSHDKDGDGVDDDADQCPDLAEDRDGIQDGDGCPEDDADDDGVPDAQDACPLLPGVPATSPGRNGCPASGGPR